MYKNNIKKSWEIIKESIGKGYCNHQSFPKKLVIDKERNTLEGLIAKHFNTYFAQIGTNLAKTIEASSIKFEILLKKYDSIQTEIPLSVNELKDAFFSLKINKSSCYNDTSFNIVRNCFGPLLKPLMHVFNLSPEKGILAPKNCSRYTSGHAILWRHRFFVGFSSRCRPIT